MAARIMWIRRHRFFIFLSVLTMTGCGMQFPQIDQEAMDDLSAKAQEDQGFVRIYASGWLGVGQTAIHPWFIIKDNNSPTIERWELWPDFQSPHGDIWRDYWPPITDLGGGVFLIAETTGPEAEKVAEFIRTQSSAYPYKDTFSLLGPNCNTYTQWGLDQTGWDVELPDSAIGKDWLHFLYP